MKRTCIASRCYNLGFTIVELLVVIGMVGLLAALVLPTLVKAKAKAIDATCKSNLHQVGIALNVYTDTEQHFPIGESLDGRGAWQWTICNTNNDKILYCPQEVKSTDDFKKYIRPLERIYPHYGYNTIGTVERNPPSDNLGFAGKYVWSDSNAGHFEGLKSSKVVSPSSTIVIGDGLTLLYPFGLTPGTLSPENGYYSISPGILPRYGVPGVDKRHGGGANMLIVEGWVKWARQSSWIEATAESRRRWNIDNQPHPETWGL